MFALSAHLSGASGESFGTFVAAAAAGAEEAPVYDHTRLIIAAILGIALIIAMISWLKMNPFISLFIGALTIGLGAGMTPTDALASFTKTFGTTLASVGILVGLGAMFGKILADSGGADRIVDTLIRKARPSMLPWVMALVGALIGLPMFFEVGLVLLMPVILLVTRRSGLPLMRIAIPTLAGLSVMHGLVPPHPGPLAAIGLLNADLGRTLLFGIIIAIPTVILSGPVFSRWVAKWVPVGVPELANALETPEAEAAMSTRAKRPSFAMAVGCILLPVVLMLIRSAANIISNEGEYFGKVVITFLGEPIIALTFGLLVGMVVLGFGGGMTWKEINGSISEALPPIAAIVFIVGAGGGLKGVLVDTGIGNVIADAIKGSSISPLILAWLVAVVIRVATGSATVATVTAAGILVPVAASLPVGEVSLMVLAIGSGSLFLSHVNDAGFWLVKEFNGVTVAQNFKSWSAMECLVSVLGLVFALALSIFV